MLGFSLGVAVGLVLLVKAGDRFVGGAASIATTLHISPVVVGALVIGFGTSVPEMMVSGFAAGGGDTELGIGNVVGSNLANLSLVLGIGALLTAMVIDTGVLRREAPLSTASCALFAVLVWNGLSRTDGILLVVLLVAFVAWVLRDALRSTEPELTEEITEFVTEFGEDLGEDVEELAELVDELADGDAEDDGASEVDHVSEVDRVAGVGDGAGGAVGVGVDAAAEDELPSVPWLVGVTLVGLVGTLVGARLLVWGAVGIADELGLAQGFVGLTLVAVGTSLPELVTAVIGARRDEEELIVGNLLGSNIFNSLAVGGVIGLVGPGPLEDPAVTHRAVIVMMGIVTMAWLFMRTGRRVTRAEAGALLGAYVVSLPLLAG